MKVHAKFGSSGPYGVEQKDILSFQSINLCKTCDPQGRAKFS